MFDNIEMIRMARALTAHAATRQQVIARNVANADTPGFKSYDVRPFSESYDQAETAPMRATRSNHYAEASWSSTGSRVIEDKSVEAAPNGNSVSVEEEMFRIASNRREHEMSVSIYRSALSLMRTSLGRRG